MEWLETAILIIYTLIAVKLFIRLCGDGFSNREKEAKAREIIGNRELFNPENASYSRAKSKLSWMDPVIYYDTVRLANRNQLNLRMVNSIM